MNIGGLLTFIRFLKDNHEWISIIIERIRDHDYKGSATILLDMIVG